MKKAQIEVGERYIGQVSGRTSVIRIDSVYGRGWKATNLTTGREIYIKSAMRLRCKSSPELEKIYIKS